jgi:hypothetical protein
VPVERTGKQTTDCPKRAQRGLMTAALGLVPRHHTASGLPAAVSHHRQPIIVAIDEYAFTARCLPCLRLKG